MLISIHKWLPLYKTYGFLLGATILISMDFINIHTENLILGEDTCILIGEKLLAVHNYLVI